MIGVVILTIIALVIGIIIVGIDNKYSKNDKVSKILKLLPGYNCGGCGYINCNNMASQICNNKECLYKCRPLKDKEAVLKKVNDILK